MEISILQGIEGAKAAKGLTVIIDVFRAFSLEAYLFDMGAEKILPIGNAETAYALKAENPDYVLAGERGGKIMPGFDTGNSPSQLSGLPVCGKTVVQKGFALFPWMFPMIKMGNDGKQKSVSDGGDGKQSET